MPSPPVPGTFHVGGAPAEFASLYTRAGFEVPRKARHGRIAFVIARKPKSVISPAHPGSVVREFASADEARKALDAWAEAPVLSRIPRKLPKLGAYRRNSTRPRRKKETAQLFLNL
jgi:hypothetical protein